MKKINEKEMMERYMSSRSGAYSWPMPSKEYDPQVYTINHPAMLHSAADIAYTKAHLGQQPWADAYQKLLTSGFSGNDYKASPVKILARLDAGNWGDGGGRWDDAGIRDLYYPGIHNLSLIHI